jgi:hypothetical protein
MAASALSLISRSLCARDLFDGAGIIQKRRMRHSRERGNVGDHLRSTEHKRWDVSIAGVPRAKFAIGHPGRRSPEQSLAGQAALTAPPGSFPCLFGFRLRLGRGLRGIGRGKEKPGPGSQCI